MAEAKRYECGALSWESAGWQSNLLVLILLLNVSFAVQLKNGFWFATERCWIVWLVPEISDLFDFIARHAAVRISRNWCKLIFQKINKTTHGMSRTKLIFPPRNHDRLTRKYSSPQNPSIIVKSPNFNLGWLITKTFWKI